MIPLGLALLHTIVVPHFLMLLDTITVLDAIKNFIVMLRMIVIIYGAYFMVTHISSRQVIKAKVE